MHCHLRTPVPPVILGFNHATRSADPQRSSVSTRLGKKQLWVIDNFPNFPRPFFGKEIWSRYSLETSRRNYTKSWRIQNNQSLVNPKNVLNFPCVDLFDNQSMSKATGVKTQTTFWICSPRKITGETGEMSSKCIKFNLGPNLWCALRLGRMNDWSFKKTQQ